MEVGLFLLAVVAVIGIAVGAYVLQQRRRGELAAFATGAGMQYSQSDPFATVRLPFELFHEGDGRKVENVCWGQADGLDLRVFDYWYYEETRDSRGHRHRSYHRYSCTLIGLEGVSCPHLIVTPEGVSGWLKNAIGFRDLQFESEDFNRAFRVRCDVDQFAYALLDARMMEWLLVGLRSHRVEVHGDLVLVATGKLPPASWWDLLTAARGFRDHVPSVVPSLYPRGAPEPMPPPLTEVPLLPDSTTPRDEGVVPKWTL